MSDTNIDITIKLSGDTKYELLVSPLLTVYDLKELIADKADIPADRQRLIYSGKVLKDTETIASYKVQTGHTIHMVRSAARATGAPSASNATGTSGNTTSASATPSGSTNITGNSAAGTGVPSNIAAGQGLFNPLADLTGARYAGYAQLPLASMFGPDGGMNAMPDPDQLALMMNDPMVQQQLNAMLLNPQMIDYMINQNPQLRAMGPQARQMLQSPMFRQMMTNPEMMRMMMSMGPMMGGAGPGAGQGASAFPAPGANPNVADTSTDSTASAADTPTTNATANNANAAAAANPFTSLFPGGVPPVDPFALFGGGAPAPVDNRPPEERYESQLRQLNDMGFFDFDRNVEALRRTGGSVQGAIEYLLSNN